MCEASHSSYPVAQHYKYIKSATSCNSDLCHLSSVLMSLSAQNRYAVNIYTYIYIFIYILDETFMNVFPFFFIINMYCIMYLYRSPGVDCNSYLYIYISSEQVQNWLKYAHCVCPSQFISNSCVSLQYI